MGGLESCDNNMECCNYQKDYKRLEELENDKEEEEDNCEINTEAASKAVNLPMNTITVEEEKNITPRKPDIPLPEGDLTELKQAFDFFDTDKDELISPKETSEFIERIGFDRINPELYHIMKELDTPENETINFPKFANHIVNSITDKYSHNGIRTIFNLYVDDTVDETVSLINLRKIINELKEEPSKKQIDKLLEKEGSINSRLTFEEFFDFMQNAYRKDFIEEPKENKKKL